MQLSHSSVLEKEKSNSPDKHCSWEIRNASSLQYLPHNTCGPSKLLNKLKNGTTGTIYRGFVGPQIKYNKMGTGGHHQIYDW